MTASRIIEIDLGSRRDLRRIHRVSETESFSLRTGRLEKGIRASDICGYSTSMGWAVLAEQHIILELDGGVRDVFVKTGLCYAEFTEQTLASSSIFGVSERVLHKSTD